MEQLLNIQEQLLNIPKNTTVHGIGCSLHLNISYTCNIQRMQNVCLSYENCLFDPGTIIFAPRTFFCFRDKFLFLSYNWNGVFCRTLFSGCLSTTFFLCNGVFFIIIANKKFASSDKGKKIALPDVAGIIVLLFFGSMGKGLSMGKQSIRKTCRCPVMRHPLLQNTWTSGIGPTLPLLNKHNMCQYTVPSHKKLYAWLWSGHLSILYTMPESSHLRKPGRDMWYQYQMIWWTQNLNLHPGTLVRPTS